MASRGLSSEDLKSVNQKKPPPDIEKNIRVRLLFLPYVVMEVGNGLTQELFPYNRAMFHGTMIVGGKNQGGDLLSKIESPILGSIFDSIPYEPM